jgi:hypothetical protein
MKRLALLFAMVIGLALMLNDTSSGGPPPLPVTCSSPGCNPTVSDGGNEITVTLLAVFLALVGAAVLRRRIGTRPL